MVNSASIASLQQKLRAEAGELGFAAVGFADASDDPLRARHLHEWLAAGFHGSMDWMQARAEVRQGPHSMWPDAPEELAALFTAEDVSAADIAKMTHENAMRWYEFDPFVHVPRDQATVGALREAAAGHDVSIQSRSTREKMTPEQVKARWDSMGDGAAGTGAQSVSD